MERKWFSRTPNFFNDGPKLISLNAKDGKLNKNFGGVTVTKGELIFATGSLDSNIYAYDSITGKQLWDRKLPTLVLHHHPYI